MGSQNGDPQNFFPNDVWVTYDPATDETAYYCEEEMVEETQDTAAQTPVAETAPTAETPVTANPAGVPAARHASNAGKAANAEAKKAGQEPQQVKLRDMPSIHFFSPGFEKPIISPNKKKEPVQVKLRDMKSVRFHVPLEDAKAESSSPAEGTGLSSYNSCSIAFYSFCM